MLQQPHPPAGRTLEARAGLRDQPREAADASPGRAPGGRGGPALTIGPATDAARFSLRIDPRELEGASKAYDLAMPAEIGGMTSSGARTALCLGPDEWYLIAPLADEEAIERGFASLYAGTVHSLVNIGHREVGIEVTGTAAAFALQSAIAFDLAAMPVGSGCRTLLDKAQIILLREAADRFRIEVWRSFADHVLTLLKTIGREVDLGI